MSNGLVMNSHVFGILVMHDRYRNVTGTEAGRESGPDVSSLLDVEEVAALLRCSTRHVYRLADSGKMPRPIKLGSLVRWNRAAIDDWIAGGCEPVRPLRDRVGDG